MDEDVTAGLTYAAEDGRGQGSRGAQEAIQAILADLDRRFGLPPTEFVRELARQIVDEVRRDGALLRLIARELVAVTKGR